MSSGSDVASRHSLRHRGDCCWSGSGTRMGPRSGHFRVEVPIRENRSPRRPAANSWRNCAAGAESTVRSTPSGMSTTVSTRQYRCTRFAGVRYSESPPPRWVRSTTHSGSDRRISHRERFPALLRLSTKLSSTLVAPGAYRSPCWSAHSSPGLVSSSVIDEQRTRRFVRGESMSSGETASIDRNSFAVLPSRQHEEFAIAIELPRNTIVRDSNGDATGTVG